MDLVYKDRKYWAQQPSQVRRSPPDLEEAAELVATMYGWYPWIVTDEEILLQWSQEFTKYPAWSLAQAIDAMRRKEPKIDWGRLWPYLRIELDWLDELDRLERPALTDGDNEPATKAQVRAAVAEAMKRFHGPDVAMVTKVTPPEGDTEADLARNRELNRQGAGIYRPPPRQISKDQFEAMLENPVCFEPACGRDLRWIMSPDKTKIMAGACDICGNSWWPEVQESADEYRNASRETPKEETGPVGVRR